MSSQDAHAVVQRPWELRGGGLRAQRARTAWIKGCPPGSRPRGSFQGPGLAGAGDDSGSESWRVGADRRTGNLGKTCVAPAAGPSG